MCGLRDAPQIWQDVVRRMLEDRGVTAVVGTQCMYYNASTGMVVVAHVDDFLVLGTRNQLDTLVGGLRK